MALSKADTVFRSVAANPEVDLSQEATDITATSGGAYEAPSARTAISYSGRELTVTFTASTSSSGTLLYRGDTGGTSTDFLIDISSSSLRLQDANGTVLSVPISGLTASATPFNAHFCTRANPLTTGASDAYFTECAIESVVGGKWSYGRAEHADAAHVAGDNLSIGGEWNGASLANAYSDTVSMVRIGTRFKSTTELREDFSASTAATPTSGENQAAPLVAIAGSSELGDGGSVAGPAYMLAGAQVRDCARRVMSPLVSTRFHLPQIQGRTNLVSTTADSRDDVDLIQGTEPGAANPGHGDGPSGFPEVTREFGTASKFAFEESTGSHPAFITDLQGSSDFTLSCWIRPDSFPNDMVVCGLTGGGGSSGALNDCAVLTVTSAGKVKFSWHTGITSVSYSGTTTAGLTAGTWHHIAVTGTVNINNYDIEIFIDGTSALTFSSRKPDLGSSSTWQVGRRDTAGTYSEYFEGGIRRIKIVDSVLTGNEITFEANRQQGFLLSGGKGGWGVLAEWDFSQPSDGYWPRRAFLDVDLGGDTYKAHLDTLVRRPLHRMTGRFEARILAGVHFTQPPGTSETVDQVKVAIVATNRQPGKVTIGGPPPKTVYGTATITGTLERVEFEDLTLPRDEDGQCWFYLASRIGAGSPSQHTGVHFDACQIVAYSKEPSTSYPFPFASP